MMDDGHYPDPPDSAEDYLRQIDESRLATIQGVPHLCVNPDKGVWQPLESVPLPLLQRIAVECFTAQLEKRQQPPPFVVPRERWHRHE